MNNKTLFAFALLLPLAAAVSPQAAAGCPVVLKVVGTTSKTIRIYDAGGKKLGEIDKALAVDQPVQDCDESLGLVMVQLKDSRVVWINRGETKRVGDAPANPEVCVTDSSTKDPGHTIVATSGADPSPVHCKPPSK